MRRDLSTTIKRLSSHDSITVTRYAAPTVGTDGVVVAGSTSTFPLAFPSIQEPDGKDLLLLPEGVRAKETIVIFCAEALRTADANAGTIADLVTTSRGNFQVQNVRDWSANGNFYRAIATRIEL